MPDSTPVNTADPGIEVGTFFVRNRNTLIARADLGPLFVDYYLHLAQHGLRYAGELDGLFKRCLAGFVLHVGTRPWNELSAWTLHFERLGLNLFLTADNETGAVTGRLFEEDVKAMGTNLFFSDVIRGSHPKRRSAVEFQGDDPAGAIRTFYERSEQRGMRLFDLGEDKFVLLVEHPDCDRTWFDALEADGVRRIDEQETVVPLERRIHRWHCGCNQGRMMEVLASAFRQDPDGLFEGDPSLEMRCPRCGARHVVTREALEAHVAGKGSQGT